MALFKINGTKVRKLAAKDLDLEKHLKKKRAIFATIGSNIILKDKKLTIERLHPFMLIENEVAAQQKLALALEHEKTLENQESFQSSAPRFQTLLAWEAAFRTYDWTKAFPDPEVATRQIRGLLALV